ncbi:hypothetical protein ABEB36_010112 [Hypothenemus hampei]|uniref:THO complex subunit 5 n=1 Tax=Hypothenemus hampei TaxID=57062 RepID=A0ABD1EKN9_HYPHA
MVKDPNSSAPLKKKRKTVHGEAETESDIYQKICDNEVKEAKSRDSAKDSKLYYQTLSKIHEQLIKVRDLKLLGPKGSSEQYESLSSFLAEVVINICLIKKLNRMDKLNQVSERDSLNVEKQKCDSIKLNYQNLVYEFHHLLNETNKCLAFKSEFENIELVSFEEFMANAPESITSEFKNLNLNDSEATHSLKLATLEWELTQRKNLAEQCKLLEDQKKKIVSDITEKNAKLNEISPLLNTILKAAKPLQEHLGLSTTEMREEHPLALLLADPLYILYANIVAYKGAFETTLTVTIVGDKDEATQFNEAQEVVNANFLNEDDSEPEFDLPEVEEVVEVKKRRHRKAVQQVDPFEEKKKKLLEMHPLKVEVNFFVEDGPELSVNFSYYTKLKLVTVNSKVKVPTKITANSAKEILAGHNILSELIDSDTGLESPNPSTGYLLKKMGLGSFQLLIPDIGYAYGWAQSVCGINFLTSKKFCEKLSQQNVEITLKIIRKRLANRTHLARQMQQLESNILPSIPKSIDVPMTHVSQLNKWTSISFQEFCQASFTQTLIDEDFVTSSDLFYSVKIVRGEAVLETLVVIKNTYPTPAPLFALNLNYKGELNSTNCDEIRDMERILNVEWDHGVKSSSWLLSAQLTYLCSFLDIYLETLDQKDFPPNTKFIRTISGRNRRRPFVFRKIGTGIFSQY